MVADLPSEPHELSRGPALPSARPAPTWMLCLPPIESRPGSHAGLGKR